MKPTIAVYSLGCRANQFDSESLFTQFQKEGYTRVAEYSPADVHLVNTCTVTNTGDNKGRQLIKKVLKLNTGKVVVTGCSAQQNAQALSDLGVDLVVDNANKEILFQEFEKAKPKGTVVHTNIREVKTFSQSPIDHFGEKTRAHLKIQDGCNQYCTYCIIPHVRGRSRSQQPLEVLEQLQRLLRNGYREIVLTGIHVGHYASQGLRFPQILQQILECAGDFRIRLSSIEPREITSEVIDLFKAYPEKLCRHLHIAIQSANSEILSGMRRGYDRKFLEKLFDTLYHIDPHFGIGIDAIVGFPGETETQFKDTCDFVEKYPISYGHVFRFSPKKGTPAAKYPDAVLEKDKVRRSRQLRKVIAERQKIFFESQFNSVHELLFETESSGCTPNFTHVKLTTEKSKPGESRQVRLGHSFSQNENEKFPVMEGEIIGHSASRRLRDRDGE